MHSLCLLLTLGLVYPQDTLFSQMANYQLPTLSQDDFHISFRTYVEYDNKAYMPLNFGFTQKGDKQY